MHRRHKKRILFVIGERARRHQIETSAELAKKYECQIARKTKEALEILRDNARIWHMVVVEKVEEQLAEALLRRRNEPIVATFTSHHQKGLNIMYVRNVDDLKSVISFQLDSREDETPIH
jgi:hypothetical protein